MPPNPFILSIISFVLASKLLRFVPVMKAMGRRCRERRTTTDG
jgi:hypothetical protein